MPPLKKVSKYQTQLEKMRQWTYKLAKMDMRGGLKSVRKEIALDDKVSDASATVTDLPQLALNLITTNASNLCLVHRARKTRPNPNGLVS